MRPYGKALWGWIAMLGWLLAAPGSAEEGGTPPAACDAICNMEEVCKTLPIESQSERVTFCRTACASPLFDPGFRSCLAQATECAAFSACGERFSHDLESPAEPPVTGPLEVGASLPTTPCGEKGHCTYPEVCCTRTYTGSSGHNIRRRECGERHCPAWCLGGFAPWCIQCGCPSTHDVYPHWPPPSAQQLALAAYDGNLVLAYRPVEEGDNLHVTLSSDGHDFDDGSKIHGIGSRLGPSLTVFDGRLVLAYRKEHDDEIGLAVSDDGKSFETLMDTVPGARSRHPPAVVSFGRQLHVFFVARHKSNPVFRVSTTDGQGREWTRSTSASAESSTPLAVTSFDGQLFMAYRANDSTQRLVVARTTDLEHWSSVALPVQFEQAPAMAELGGRLVVAFNGGLPTDPLGTVASSDGVEFGGVRRIQGQATPLDGEVALASFESRLYLAYKGDDDDGTLYVTASADGKSWDQAVELTGQTTP